MNRRRRSYSAYRQFPLKPPLIICAAAFLCGLIIGTVAAGIAASGEQFARDVCTGLAREGERFTGFLLYNVKFHLAAVFLSVSLLGAALIPALCAFRGFLLAFSIASAARVFSSFSLVLSAFGVTALLVLPCFLVLSTQAMTASAMLLKASFGVASANKPRIFLKQFALSCAVSAVIITAGSALEAFVLHNITASILQKLCL